MQINRFKYYLALTAFLSLVTTHTSFAQTRNNNDFTVNFTGTITSNVTDEEEACEAELSFKNGALESLSYVGEQSVELQDGLHGPILIIYFSKTYEMNFDDIEYNLASSEPIDFEASYYERTPGHFEHGGFTPGWRPGETYEATISIRPQEQNPNLYVIEATTSECTGMPCLLGFGFVNNSQTCVAQLIEE